MCLLMLFAYLRGTELHGGSVGGIIYVLILFVSAWLIVRSAMAQYHFVWKSSLVLILLIWSILCWPYVFFPNRHSHFGMFAFKKRMRSEFNSVVLSDPSLSKLSIAFHEYKNTDIYIEGQLPDEADYINFRNRILHECPTLSKTLREDSTFLLKWNILIVKSGKRKAGYDNDLFDSS